MEPELGLPKCCGTCGSELEWIDCYMIDCEDGMYSLYDEDPVNFSPDDMDVCSECGGDGGWLVCAFCERGADSAEVTREQT